MNPEDKQTITVTAAKRLFLWWRSRPIWVLALIFIALSTLYWQLIASDRYVSSARVVVQRTDLPGGSGGIDISGFLGGVLGGSNAQDALLLQAYLQSIDVLRRLDEKLHLKAHFGDPSHDILSRLWRNEIEWFHRHYLNRVNLYFDERSGTLVIDAQAYDPQTAQAIARSLVEEGERYMNDLGHTIAREQVRFLEGQVKDIQARARDTRQRLLAYQTKHRIVSPTADVQSATSILAQLDAKRIELEAQLAAFQAYLVADHPSIVQIKQQIQAIERQINTEKTKLTASGGQPLTHQAEEFQRLEFDAAFAQEIYKSALAALERGRVDAARTLKKVAVVQSPGLPEYPEEPRRWYNTAVFGLDALLLAGIVQLIVAIVREHRD
jgi:capsular polysaccharide transport system permease protein